MLEKLHKFNAWYDSLREPWRILMMLVIASPAILAWELPNPNLLSNVNILAMSVAAAWVLIVMGVRNLRDFERSQKE